MHQGASLSLDAEQNISNVFWYPLVSIAGFVFLFIALVLLPHPDRNPRAPSQGADRAGTDGVMVDLGKYAGEVLAAYGVTAVLLLGLVALSIAQGRRVKRRLDEAEARRGNG